MEHTLPLDTLLDALAGPGWCVLPQAFAPDQVAALRATCLERHQDGQFHPAGVGAKTPSLRSEIRGDHIRWIEQADPDPAVQTYLAAMDDLRQGVNQAFYLGLHELEAHFAVYPQGSGYKRHLDRFRDDDRRTLTAIVYLNQDWADDDGGMLHFWPDPAGTGEAITIPPRGGTLVTFLSDRFWHEVAPARRQRLALTGWFKRR